MTSATIVPSLSPDRLGAKAALTVTISYASAPGSVPAAVRSSVIDFPAGLSIDIPHLISCRVARLRSHGAHGCSRRSRIGSGHALVESFAGSLLITEAVTLSAFLGPPQENLEPTVEILAEGFTPLMRRMVFSGKVSTGQSPYGERLAMRFPPIPTTPLEPDASLLSFSLTVGASERHLTHATSTVLVPRSCPTGGFPFAADFDYADGSTGSAQATIACPR
jgi:hypothetical protein